MFSESITIEGALNLSWAIRKYKEHRQAFENLWHEDFPPPQTYLQYVQKLGVRVRREKDLQNPATGELDAHRAEHKRKHTWARQEFDAMRKWADKIASAISKEGVNLTIS